MDKDESPQSTAGPDLRLRMCLYCYWLFRGPGAYYCDRNETPDHCTYYQQKRGIKDVRV